MSEVPIGRRVAYWRVRRRMSQQVFADRLGKSKSWVDKVERGVRTLDKVSTLRDIANVLRIDREVLLGRDARPVDGSTRIESVELIGAALSAYDIALDRPAAREVPDAARVVRGVAHAWTSYQHARYPALIDLLPGLLAGAQRRHAHEPLAGRVSLVEAYRVTASLLVKLGETELAWLAADRAMALSAGDPVLVASATVQLGQVLRATGRARAAGTATLAAAYRIGTLDLDAARLSLCGTLLVQAALAAARQGDDRAAAARLDEAADLAAEVGDGHDHQHTGFGPTAVALAGVTVAIELGTPDEAILRHEEAIGRDGWRWLAPEHRAAHLIDAGRAYLQNADPVNAARVLLAAHRTAPAEVRHRPAARQVLADAIRCPDAPATIVALAATLGVSRA
ncbi:helix-turn-helix domain-containing protein [Micromonospora sp. FIMYZ51]|uniref:helix-turn-helix domain-containing protein n=1 Tax=Micromonospora sp. FIMYZ51 TaxID=3051832 RepID=UPI00311E51B3